MSVICFNISRKTIYANLCLLLFSLAPAHSEEVFLLDSKELGCVLDNLAVYMALPNDPITIVLPRCPDARFFNLAPRVRIEEKSAKTRKVIRLSKNKLLCLQKYRPLIARSRTVEVDFRNCQKK